MNRFRPHYDPMDGPLTPEEAAREWDTGIYGDEDDDSVDSEPDYEEMARERDDEFSEGY
jgi:hypothetical protein